MFIFSHYLVFHNKPRSHYHLIYTISPPQHCQLNKAKGFLRSRLTDLSLICTTAPQSPIAGANKPPTTRPDKCTDYHCIVVRAQHRVCCVGGWRANRMSRIKARVADGSECGSLEAGGDNGGRKDPGDPSWMESCYMNSTSQFKVYSCLSNDAKHRLFHCSELCSSCNHPLLHSHTHTHKHMHTHD